MHSKRFIARAFCVLIFLGCSGLLGGCDSFKRRGVAPGDLAPELKINDITGLAFSLSDLRGKVVLVNFWATWCGPCVLELPALERLQQKFLGRNFTVVGVGIDDDRESIMQFKAQYGLTFPIINDVQGVSRQGYHLSGVPETVLLDRNGKIVMFMDPENHEPTAKVSGPREWDQEFMVSQIEKLLS